MVLVHTGKVPPPPSLHHHQRFAAGVGPEAGLGLFHPCLERQAQTLALNRAHTWERSTSCGETRLCFATLPSVLAANYCCKCRYRGMGMKAWKGRGTGEKDDKSKSLQGNFHSFWKHRYALEPLACTLVRKRLLKMDRKDTILIFHKACQYK